MHEFGVLEPLEIETRQGLLISSERANAETREQKRREEQQQARRNHVSSGPEVSARWSRARGPGILPVLAHLSRRVLELP
ncbi:MAG: hypothetical protein DHS20C15_20340 [Planctomycetota bacterium]|nr:MAG: hypothetical protein DHS20C15_20340 [Planctomycetota bacterium]